ncbi:MAG: hypothetical protein K1X86_13625 [Ignavibacteria bacterium]|nr:hypothetical protein [Ignavibacteria bacterium]
MQTSLKSKLLLVLAAIFIISFTSQKSYSQWIPTKGKNGTLVTMKYGEFNQYYDPTGKLINNSSKFSRFDIDVFNITGISQSVAFFTKFGFAKLTNQTPSGTTSSFGFKNPSIGLVYQINPGPPVMGLELEANLPLHFPRDQDPALDADFATYSIGFTIGNGMRLFRMPSYYSAGVKYKFRGAADAGEELSVYFTLGSSFNKYTSWYATIESNRGLNGNNQSSTKLSGAIVQKISKSMSLSFGTEYIVAGKNVSTGPSLFLGFNFGY